MPNSHRLPDLTDRPTWPPTAECAAVHAALAAGLALSQTLGPALSTATLTIEHTWDRRPVAPAAQTTLRITEYGSGLQVLVDAPFFGDPPPPDRSKTVGVDSAHEFTPGLWQFEVVEVFFLGSDQRYLEVELSPHGNHLVLALQGVRMLVAEGLPLAFSAAIDGSRWHGRAFIPAALLPPGWDRLNAFAIHGEGTHRQYQAWRPAGGTQPDFHVLSAFGFGATCGEPPGGAGWLLAVPSHPG